MKVEQLLKRETIDTDLKALRDRFGKTITEVAKESGISVPTIIHIENNTNNRKDVIKSKTIFTLNRYFNKLAAEETL